MALIDPPEIRPRLAFHVPGDPLADKADFRRRDVTSFSISADVRTLYDGWSMTVPNPEGKFNYMLRWELQPIWLYHADPAIKGGAERPWYKGVITRVRQRNTEAGTVLEVSGYDNAWHLTSHAPHFVRFRGATWADMARKFVDKSWGIKLVFEGNFARQLKSGRADAEANRYLAEAKAAQQQQIKLGRQDVGLALFAQFKAMIPVVQSMPGQTVGDLLTKYAKLAAYPNPGGLVNAHPDGNLCIFQPDYKQRPRYVFHHHRPDHPEAKKTNVYQPDYDRNAEVLYNDVSCVGTVIVGLTMPNTADPNEGKFTGRHVDLTATEGVQLPTSTIAVPRRRFVFMDPDRLNKPQARARAKWQYNQGLYERETLVYVHQGHSQRKPQGDAEPFIENTMAEVHDSVNGLDGTYYVSRVQCMLPLDGPSYTIITLKPPGLLAA